MVSDGRFEDEEDELPLHQPRAFGAGLHRKPIAFLPAKSGDLSSTSEANASSQSVADLYLDIVLSKTTNLGTTKPGTASPPICEVCQLPLDEPTSALSSEKSKPKPRPHEVSIAHQVCLAHSHPPSALDRSRLGLSLLQSQGWDPDSRSGLGVEQQGMRFPAKAKEKHDNLGIGVKVPKNLEVYKKEQPQKLDAGKVRKMAVEDKKRRERLQRQFYGNGELEKYLGGN